MVVEAIGLTRWRRRAARFHFQDPIFPIQFFKISSTGKPSP
jgi:hypothetical protein